MSGRGALSLRALVLQFSCLAHAAAAAGSSQAATGPAAPPGEPAGGDRHVELCLRSPPTNRAVAHCWFALQHGLPFGRELDQAEALHRLAADYIAQGSDAPAWPLLERAIRIFSAHSGVRGSLAEALAARGQIRLRRWEIDEGRQDLTAAVDLARAAAKPRLEAALLTLLSRLDLGVGQLKAAEKHLEKVQDLYGEPSDKLKAEFRQWIRDRQRVLPDLNAALTQYVLGTLAEGRPGGSSTVPVDEIEVDYGLHVSCLTFGSTPGFKEHLCEGPAARQRIVDTLRIAHDVSSLAYPLVRQASPSQQTDAEKFCPLLEQSEMFFDRADLSELTGNMALANTLRRQGKELWLSTSGEIVRQNDDAMIEMARRVGQHFFPERVQPASPEGTSGILMKGFVAEERPESIAFLLGDCSRRDSLSSLRLPPPGNLATLPSTLHNRLVGRYKDLSLPPAMALARAKSAREAVAAGDRESALALYKEALALAESRSTDPTAVSVDLAARTARLYGEFIVFLADMGRPELAFDVAERSRYLAFNNSVRADLSRIRSRHAEALVALRRLDRQIAVRQGAIQSRKDSAPKEYPTILGGLEIELGRLIAERDQGIARLRAVDPETAVLYAGEAADLRAVQESILPPDTAMVAYFLTREHALAWVIGSDAVKLVRLGKSPAEIEGLVKDFQNALLDRAGRAEEPWKALSEELYDVLLRPLEPSLHHPNVILVPHGILHTLPFAALRSAQSGRFVGEERTLSTAPSATALRFLGGHVTPLGRRMLAFGNPDGTLPFAGQEARAVAALFGVAPVLGAEATAGRLQREGAAADIIHLAVHASGEDDTGGALELAPQGEAGLLRVPDILRMNLTETNLVVLSACDTAFGSVAGGDSMATLNRAFLIAGSPTVLATLWPVDDEASLALSTAFYRHLLKAPVRGYPEALRRAQEEVRAEPKWVSPYYWSGFVLAGDVGRPATPAASRSVEAADAEPTTPTADKPSRPRRAFLEESFEDNRNSWYHSTDPAAPATFQDGSYLFGSKAGEWRFSTIPVSLPDSRDFELRTTVKKILGDDGFFFGLIWELDNGQNFSNFALTGDGRLAVTRKRAGGFTDFIDTSRSNPAVRQGNARNELRVTRKAGATKFFVNGVQVHEMSDRPAFGNAMGFLVYGNVLLAFEELIVSEAP